MSTMMMHIVWSIRAILCWMQERSNSMMHEVCMQQNWIMALFTCSRGVL
jgi:hypothetical protein